MSRDAEQEVVKRALESAQVPEPILEARQKQDNYLKRNIPGRNYKIADIGCGKGYHALAFAPYHAYHGFEIAPAIAQSARDLLRQRQITNAEIFVGDAADMELQQADYDVVICLYFTPGNLREPSNDMAIYTDTYLDQNPVFIRIMGHFYRALKAGGHMYLTVYRDVREAEAAQRSFYQQNDMQVITAEGSRFVATAEGFWSARWTRASMLSNLAGFGVVPAQVTFHELNAIAWLVDIRK